MSEPRILFHGTTDNALPSILERGLVSVPFEQRVSASSSGAWSHLMSFDGVYAAVSSQTALDYAEKASKERGGEPMLVCILADMRDCHPDEDDLIEFVGNYGEDMGHLFPTDDFAESWKDPAFRARVAGKMTQDMIATFQPLETDGTEAAVVGLLSAMFDGRDAETMASALGERMSVLAPDILEPLLSEPGGEERYRAAMDRLARSMVGTVPYESEEYHKVRIKDGVGYSGRSRVVAIGVASDPTAYFGGDLSPEVQRVLIDEGLIDPGFSTAAPA